jgi:lactate dehydrogenase-like 2-hydroxyacid dehydrogenase
LILINTSRGPVVDIDALHDAMKDGIVLATGLDVPPEEPVNTQRRLIAAWQRNEDWIRHRLLLTPHSASYTPESMCDNRGLAPRLASCATGGWRTVSTCFIPSPAAKVPS